ncbi:MAG: hypothetical protein RIT43_1741 [Bacteroidota bacterium]|jgi:hypothetical protein
MAIAFAQVPDSLPLNRYRFLASHNSYKKKPDPSILKFLTHFKRHLSGDLDPIQMDYGHEPLSKQLDSFNIRGFEIDLYFDPKGGKYRKRRVNLFVKGLKQRSKDSLLRVPGFKVLHIADVDYESNYTTFSQVLEELQAWSEGHPQHTPLFVNLEIKTATPGNYSRFLRLLGFKKAVPFTEIAMQALDKEVLEAWKNTPQKLFTPERLKGEFKSVSDRLDSLGWPTLHETLGTVFFILDGDPTQKYSTEKSRPMFVYGPPGENETAFVIKNDPIGKEDEILALTQKYIVRTRSDAGTLEARANDYTRLRSAWKSGAQIISTDYYRPDQSLSDFYIQLDRKDIIEKKQ